MDNSSLHDDLKHFFIIHPQILRIDTKRRFDVYVLNQSKNMELFHPANSTYTERTHRIIFKNSIPRLFVRKRDKVSYLSYIDELTPTLLYDPLIVPDNKAEMVYETISSVAITIFDNLTVQTLIHYKKLVQAIYDFSLKENRFLKELLFIPRTFYNEYNHLVNVGIYGMGLAKEILEPSKHNLEEIIFGFFIHDIGKYSIPKHISQKTGPLDAEAWDIIKKHPLDGCDLLKRFKLLSDEVELIIMQHHERFDGSGYPRGLKLNQIHPYAKICAIADAFDALSSQRPYREATTSFKALGIMRNEMKNDFDPDMFKKFVMLFSKN